MCRTLDRLGRVILLLLASWLAAWRRWGDRWGWLGMLNAWVEWGAVALGIGALLHSVRARSPLALAPLALAATEVTRLGAPALSDTSRVAAPVGSERLRLFSANLFVGNHNVRPHVDLILARRPDIVLFQELTPYHLAALDKLAATYSYRVLRPRRDAYGFGALSRFPLEETGYWETPGVKPWGQRLRVTLPDGAAIELYNVHLLPPTARSTFEMGLTKSFRDREAQLRVIQAEIDARGLPALIAGDCNFADGADAYRIATGAWRDAWAAGEGNRRSWPAWRLLGVRLPFAPRLLRLDYCFHTPEFVATHMRVESERTGSDHCPILVDLVRA